jgi:hypothetical protein
LTSDIRGAMPITTGVRAPLTSVAGKSGMTILNCPSVKAD